MAIVAERVNSSQRLLDLHVKGVYSSYTPFGEQQQIKPLEVAVRDTVLRGCALSAFPFYKFLGIEFSAVYQINNLCEQLGLILRRNVGHL